MQAVLARRTVTHSVRAGFGQRRSRLDAAGPRHAAGQARCAPVPCAFMAGSERVPGCQPTSYDGVQDYDGKYGGSAARRTDKTRASAHPESTMPRPGPGPAGSSSSSEEPDLETALLELSEQERATVALFRFASPSVVNVSTSVRAQGPFPFMLSSVEVPRGVGSGFIWDKAGHVITNNHVVAGASEVKVTTSDGTVHKARVVGRDAERDVAVLELYELSAGARAALAPLAVGSSSRLMVGQRVLAIGNPFGLDQTLTQGIVSGLGREISAPGRGAMARRPISNVIQTDAAINPGNSGGPLLDGRGRVVGINTAIADPTGVGISSGVGFAIPIDSVKGLVEQLLSVGRVLRPSMGITIYEPSPEAKRRLLRGRDGGGVIVAQVLPGGPAALTGVKGITMQLVTPVITDVITAINGKPVRTQKDLFAILDACTVGQAIEVTLWRAGVTRTTRMTLADREKLDA